MREYKDGETIIYILKADKWKFGTYDLSEDFALNTYDIELDVLKPEDIQGGEVVAPLFEALIANAEIESHEDSSILVAKGQVPTMDLPIKVTIKKHTNILLP